MSRNKICGRCKQIKEIRGICQIVTIKRPVEIEVIIVALCKGCGDIFWSQLQELKGASFIRRRRLYH